MEENYTKRETDMWREEIKETLGRIEAQTTKTNGRVSSLERWQSYVIGFCACVTIVIIPLVLTMVT